MRLSPLEQFSGVTCEVDPALVAKILVDLGVDVAVLSVDDVEGGPLRLTLRTLRNLTTVVISEEASTGRSRKTHERNFRVDFGKIELAHGNSMSGNPSIRVDARAHVEDVACLDLRVVRRQLGCPIETARPGMTGLVKPKSSGTGRWMMLPGPGLFINHPTGEGTEVELTKRPAVGGHMRCWFCCPRCGCDRVALYYRDEWAWRICHELVYRSTVESGFVKAYRPLVGRSLAIAATLGPGLSRPRGMHERTFRRLLDELNSLGMQALGVLDRHRMRDCSAIWEAETPTLDPLRWSRAR